MPYNNNGYQMQGQYNMGGYDQGYSGNTGGYSNSWNDQGYKQGEDFEHNL